MNKPMKSFIAAILVIGVIRFVLSLAGVPDNVVKFFSMTVVILAGTIYFAIACSTHKERLKASFLLILPYLLVETVALGYTWLTGRPTIFHAPEYSFGTGIGTHLLGHVVGGLTWEPLTVFVVMEIIRAVYAGGRWVRAHAIG